MGTTREKPHVKTSQKEQERCGERKKNDTQKIHRKKVESAVHTVIGVHRSGSRGRLLSQEERARGTRHWRDRKKRVQRNCAHTHIHKPIETDQ